MSGAMTAAEVVGLPALLTVPQACRALGIDPSTGYRMRRDGEFPIEVVQLGGPRQLRCRRSDLLTFLGITTCNGGAGSCHPAPPDESTRSTSDH